MFLYCFTGVLVSEWVPNFGVLAAEQDNMGFHENAGSNNWAMEVRKYCQTCNISRNLGNKIFDHSDVFGALPIGTVPTTSSFST